MTELPWSWVLTFVTAGVLLVAARGGKWWLTGIGSESLWMVYGFVTKQYGFILKGLIFGAVCIRNWRNTRDVDDNHVGPVSPGEAHQVPDEWVRVLLPPDSTGDIERFEEAPEGWPFTPRFVFDIKSIRDFKGEPPRAPRFFPAHSRPEEAKGWSGLA